MTVLGPDEPLTRLLERELGDVGPEAVVYAPSRSAPDLEEAEEILAGIARRRPARAVVLSSTEVHEPHHHHAGMVEEERLARRPGMHPRARTWLELERLAEELLRGLPGTVLTVLRPAPAPLPGASDPWSRLLSGPLAATLPGHDPSIQLLAPEDLVAAIRAALAGEPGVAAGTFQVVPAGVVPLTRALRLSGVRRLPLPGPLHRLVPTGRAAPAGWPEYFRYPWTASGERARRVLGFAPRRTSAEAALAFRGDAPPTPAPAFDDFGMDPAYIARYGRHLFRFLHDAWWRVEVRGLEHVPREGRAVLTGVHRGFMPFDGVMALHLLVRETGRYPRFLIHPTLVKFPFLAGFMTRLGGVPACRENADRILAAEGMVGVFPEGIRGAFTPYRRAYRLGKFGRDEYVRMALRNRAPIVPFVTVGSAEIFPIVARLDWGWWKRFSEWPYFPIAPPFPLLPVPLPSKWHTRFLEPLDVGAEHGPEAADDPDVVRSISREVRRRMTEALQAMLARRRSVFYGSVFDDEEARQA
ncbi:MAG TPA: 1-acyl-sn-glycerol-3-phosphate acyltransferase [Thermoanaerobaculia bacterium]|nr:1-acyl-sn-glycerol-3-phosphate acyltransferase [Thermoanaerobaculia bacterium]